MNFLLKKETNTLPPTISGSVRMTSQKSAIEILIRTTSDQNRLEPELYQINRYDLVVVTPEGKYNLNEFNLDKDSVLQFDTQHYDIDGMDVQVNPFVWNGCDFIVDQKPNFMFESWAKKWIDIDDNKLVKEDSFANVIHSVTYPKEENGMWTTSIDFGTAPKEAFKELLTTFQRQGISRVEIHSRFFLSQ